MKTSTPLPIEMRKKEEYRKYLEIKSEVAKAKKSVEKFLKSKLKAKL